MQLDIITMYAVCADVLQAMGAVADPQAAMTTAEVMTTALVAARFFGGCIERRRHVLKEHHAMPQMVSTRRLNRRLHASPETLWQGWLATLAAVQHTLNASNADIVDSLPVAVCDNMRIRRCRLYRAAADRGECARKRRYVYGLRAHGVVTATGVPVEVVLAPASYRDGRIGKTRQLDLPTGAVVFSDAADTDDG